MGMIKSEREYAMTKNKILEMEQTLSPKEAQLGPGAFLAQLKDEVLEYEQIREGNIPQSFWLLENLGLLLIALRIKSGLTQAELASKLGVAPSQVSRDENNDYYGVSIQKAQKILSVLGVKVPLQMIKPSTFKG